MFDPVKIYVPAHPEHSEMMKQVGIKQGGRCLECGRPFRETNTIAALSGDHFWHWGCAAKLQIFSQKTVTFSVGRKG
jgi:hypothetical protein